MEQKLTLREVRSILKAAVEKGAEVGWISAYAIADAGGNIIAVQRADGAPAVAVPLAKAKASLAALRGDVSFSFEEESEAHPVRFHGHLSLSRRALFGGPGAAPIIREGQVVGGFSSSTSYAASGMQITIDGKQYSREDLVTAHALQIEYDDQHPDTP